jgi:hypothetical protein
MQVSPLWSTLSYTSLSYISRRRARCRSNKSSGVPQFFRHLRLCRNFQNMAEHQTINLVQLLSACVGLAKLAAHEIREVAASGDLGADKKDARTLQFNSILFQKLLSQPGTFKFHRGKDSKIFVSVAPFGVRFLRALLRWLKMVFFRG